MVSRGACYKNIFAGGELMFNKGLEMFQKRGAWQGRGGEKIEGCVPHRNYSHNIYVSFKTCWSWDFFIFGKPN